METRWHFVLSVEVRKAYFPLLMFPKGRRRNFLFVLQDRNVWGKQFQFLTVSLTVSKEWGVMFLAGRLLEGSKMHTVATCLLIDSVFQSVLYLLI